MKKIITSLLQFLVCISLSHQISIAAETVKKDEIVSVLFAGDIVLDGLPGKAIENGIDPFASFAKVFAQADIRIGNLECVIATDGHAADKNFTFRGHPRTLPILKQHFDAVSIANNHSGDFGKAAFVEMLGLLNQQKIQYFGGGHNLREAHTPLIIVRKGIRIAFLGYDEFMPRSFEADAKEAGVAWSEDEQVMMDIHSARTKYQADIVIPFMHWGWENELIAGARQRKLARIMIDAGADAVIGSHPHVIQDVEHYKGKPIIYSLGNFMMDALDNEAQTKGWTIQLEVSRHGVESWATKMAKIAPDGTPSLVENIKNTCWNKVDSKVKQCDSL